MKRLATLTLGLLLAALAASGCAARGGGLPRYPWTGPETAIARMAAQDDQLHTLIAQGSVTLTDAKDKTVRLDTAVVAVFPDRLRLRAWKLSEAVFDLTLKPEGVWIMVPPEMKKDGKLIPESLRAADFAKGWTSLHGEFFKALNLEVVDEGASTFFLQRRLENGALVRCQVDRDTLTVRRHLILDGDGKERFSLQYDRYRAVNGMPVPTRIIAKGDKGTIQVDLDDVQVNGPPTPNAFVPPKRAERLP
jgi:hypothetical protein